MPRPRRKDVALVVGVTDDGAGVKIVRRRDESGELEAGELRPLAEGRPISGEVLRLAPRKGVPLLYDVEVAVAADEVARASAGDAERASGPAQVATREYRDGWDAIWGARGRGSSRAN